MSDELDTYANITMRYEPRTATNLGPHASVVLDVEGRNRKVSFLIPTGPVPQHISLATCDRWVGIVQGPVISGCGIDDDQREVLLHLFLAYRAFVRGRPGTKTDHWYRFASQLVLLACETTETERVDDHLRQVVEWIHDALPVSIFIDPSIPDIVYNDAPPPALLEHIVVEPEAITREEQVALRKHLELTISRLALVALRAVPEGSPPEVFAPTLLHFARQEDHRRAQLAAALVEGTLSSPVPALEDVAIPPNMFSEQTPGRLYVTLEMPPFIVGSVYTPLVDLIVQCSLHKLEPNGTTTVLPILSLYPIPPFAGPEPSASASTLDRSSFASAALADSAVARSASTPTSDQGPIAPSAPSAPVPAAPQAPTTPSTPPTAPSTPPSAANATVTSRYVPRRLTLERFDSEALAVIHQLGPAPLGTPRATSSPRVANPGPRTRASSTSHVRQTPRARDVETAIAQRRDATLARRERQREERAARAASRAAIRASMREAGEGGTESDDSMPSLRTVTDSSDDSVSELNLTYPGED